MVKDRADLGFADALNDFDPSEWEPERKLTVNSHPAIQRPEKDLTTKAAAAAGFRSREPEPWRASSQEVPLRRRRTGRNMQFNLKAKPETIAAFCAIADRRGWGLGETLEYAVALLEQEYSGA